MAQEKGGGALVLSEFVGAAVELPDAIQTNPYSIDRMDEAIDQAIAMSPEERKARMEKMYDVVTRYDVQCWADHLFELFRSLDNKTPKKEVMTTV